jgi:hypothetical protein
MSSYNFDKIEDNIYFGDIRTAENTQFLQQFKMNTILSLVNAPIDQSNRKEGLFINKSHLKTNKKKISFLIFRNAFIL